MNVSQRYSALLTGIVAGIIGGLAEIGWVTLYADVTGEDAAKFGRGVTSAASVRALIPGRASATLSIGVNMTFAVVLGIALAFAWRAVRARRPHLTNPLPFTIPILIVIWAANSFLVLPLIRPDFTHLVPFYVSLVSSLLFGAAAAAVLYEGVV